MKRSPLRKKPRKKSLAGLKRKLWEVFSKFVRQRGMDENGMTSCISCGKTGEWHSFDAGHFIPRSAGLSTYFHETNVWTQCQNCNLFRQGNTYHYALALQKKFGEGIIEELEVIAKQSKKYYPSDYEEMIERYTSLLKD